MDLGSVAHPQLDVQFHQPSLEPARMPTGFHPHAHFHSLGGQVTVELLRCLRMFQSALLQFPSFGIHKSNLLKAGMIITPYNNHVGSLLPGLGWLAPPKSIRVREPTLLWNQLRSLTFPTSPCSMPLHGFQGGELSPRELQ